MYSRSQLATTVPNCSKQLDNINSLTPIEILCNLHPGSVCLNYCSHQNCLKLLCQQCIEEHLEFHLQQKLPRAKISSFKKIRQFCTKKLDYLIHQIQTQKEKTEKYQNKLQKLKMKFQQIKSSIIQIMETQFNLFLQKLMKQMEEQQIDKFDKSVHLMVQKFERQKEILRAGQPCLTKVINEVLCMNLQKETANLKNHKNQTNNAGLNVEIQLDRVLLIEKIKQCLTFSGIKGIDKQKQVPNIQQFKIHQKQSNCIGQSQNYLHFFEPDSSRLHILQIGSDIKEQIFQLKDFTVPYFHASLQVSNQSIFISGGVVQQQNQEVKSSLMSYFCLKSKKFIQNFCTVQGRSSHSICQYNANIYVVGGYAVSQKNQPYAETLVERINIQNGSLEVKKHSNYGGPCIATIIGNKLLKASQEGIQVFNILENQWNNVDISGNYQFLMGCGWSKMKSNELLVYGGYDENEEGSDSCFQWKILQEKIEIKEKKFRLPNKEGFLNNPGILIDGQLFTLQNIQNRDNSDQCQASIVQDQRSIIKLDGKKWEQIQL